MKVDFEVLILGGGLAGLTTALHLSEAGVDVGIIEKDPFPRHRVCGEYVSYEVLPYLQSLGIDPLANDAVSIENFLFSTSKGKTCTVALPLGGFGWSRYVFDNFLFEKAKDTVHFIFDKVEAITFTKDSFSISTQNKHRFSSKWVVGAFGKRSNIDRILQRKFIQNKTPWMAVKAHYNFDFPENLVAIHNFNQGYCGLSQTETGSVNACYLTKVEAFKTYGNIKSFQKIHMAENPHLKNFYENAELAFDAPLSISQISFERKSPIEHHVFMVGDSASLIHPLCGNGMAMAITAAKLFSEMFIAQRSKGALERETLEEKYLHHWKKTFQNRLRAGHFLQNFIMHPTLSEMGIRIVQKAPKLLSLLVSTTHGKPLQ